MTHVLPLPSFPAAAPARKQLLAATVLVVALHALLLLGLPQWISATRAGADSGAFVTRMVLPPAADTAPPQIERPAAPRPKPPPARRRVKPAAQRSAPLPPPAEEPVSAEPEPPAGGSPAVVSAGTDPDSTLLAPPPPLSFGGINASADLMPPLPPALAASALEFARAAGDAPTRIAPSARLTYRTTGHDGGEPFDLQTTLDWRQDATEYYARWVLYTPRIGDHTRTSTGLLSRQGLLPVLAAFHPPQGQDIGFDYAAQRLRFSAPGTEAPLPPGAQDRLALLLQLSALLAGDAARYPVGSRIDIPAAHVQGAGMWHFTVEAEEPLAALKDQTLATLRLVHPGEGEQDPRIEVWLARQINYLPARLRITEPNGDSVEHTLVTAYTQQVNLKPAPAPAPP